MALVAAMKLIQSLLIETNRKVGVRSLRDVVSSKAFKKKYGRLVDNLKKKMMNGSFDSELAFNAYVKLVEQFADGNYPKDIIEEIASELYESEEVELTEESDEEIELKDIVSQEFKGQKITTQIDHDIAIAAVEFDGMEEIMKFSEPVYHAIKNKVDDARLMVYISSNGVGFSLFSVDSGGSEEKFADTDLYGEYADSAVANRIVAILNSDEKVKNIVSQIGG